MNKPNDKFTWQDGDIEFDNVVKYNEHHDEQGRFASASGGASLPLTRPGASPFAEEEQQTLRDYSVNSQNLNKYLREQSQEHISDSPIVQAALARVAAGPYLSEIKALDSAFTKAKPLTEDIKVYRGLSSNAGEKLDQALAGDSNFMDLGFVSTSHDEEVAKSFAYERLGRLAEISVPKGSRVIDMNEHSFSDLKSEQEVLLNRDSHFYVEGVTRRGDLDVYRLRMVEK